MISPSHFARHTGSDVIEASLMTDIANDIKLRNDPVMRIIKFICIFLLNLNTQIKPPFTRSWRKVLVHGYRTSSIIKIPYY